MHVSLKKPYMKPCRTILPKKKPDENKAESANPKKGARVKNQAKQPPAKQPPAKRQKS